MKYTELHIGLRLPAAEPADECVLTAIFYSRSAGCVFNAPFPYTNRYVSRNHNTLQSISTWTDGQFLSLNSSFPLLSKVFSFGFLVVLLLPSAYISNLLNLGKKTCSCYSCVMSSVALKNRCPSFPGEGGQVWHSLKMMSKRWCSPKTVLCHRFMSKLIDTAWKHLFTVEWCSTVVCVI